jgi:hypothetical protein
MSNDVYGATVILMAVASLVAIGVSPHRVHTDHMLRRLYNSHPSDCFQINDLGGGSQTTIGMFCKLFI